MSLSRETPQQYTRLFVISTVYTRQSSFTCFWDTGCSDDGPSVKVWLVESVSGGSSFGGLWETPETEKSHLSSCVANFMLKRQQTFITFLYLTLHRPPLVCDRTAICMWVLVLLMDQQDAGSVIGLYDVQLFCVTRGRRQRRSVLLLAFPGDLDHRRNHLWGHTQQGSLLLQMITGCCLVHCHRGLCYRRSWSLTADTEFHSVWPEKLHNHQTTNQCLSAVQWLILNT